MQFAKIPSLTMFAGRSTVFLTSSIILTLILTPTLTIENNLQNSLDDSVNVTQNSALSEDMELYQSLKTEYEERLQKYGEKDLRTLETLSNLAGARVLINYDNNEEMSQQSLREYETVYSIISSKFGEGHQNTIEVAQKLADLYSLTGQTDKAIDLYRKIVQVQNDNGGVDGQTKSTFILTRIAFALALRGESDKALEILQPVYDLRRDVFGENHPDTIQILEYMGNVYMAKGSPLEALKIYRKVHKFKVDQFGQNHPSSLEALTWMADAYFNASRVDKALEFYNSIHDRYVQLHGREDEQTLDARLKLADAMLQLKEYENAEILYRDVLDTRTRNLEPSDPRILLAIQKLIVLYGFFKGPKSPEMLTVAQLAHNFHQNRRAKMGLDLDLEGVEALELLADVELNQSPPKSKDAFAHFKQALDLRVKLNGHKVDLGAAETLTKMAGVRETQFHMMGAVELHSQAYEARKVLLGADDPLTLNSLEGMAVSTMGLELWDKAADLFEHLYKGRLRILGPDDDETVRTMLALGHIYKSDHRWKEAEEIYRKVYESRKRTLDPDDLEIVASIKNLGIVFAETGKQSEAIKLLKEVWRIQREKLGEDSQETEETREILKRVQAGIKTARVEL